MNKQRRFEIVRRPNGRFGWVFVRREGDRTRVLARSARDYRTPAKAVDAIDRMRGADIELGGLEPDPFPLPATRFQIVAGVVPLRVDEFPVVEQDSGFFTSQQAALQTAEPKAPAKRKAKPAARKSKAKPRRTRARSAS